MTNADARKDLTDMLTRVFEDSVADEGELNVLIAHLMSGALSAGEVQEVMEAFVQNTWKQTMADGVISDLEKKKMRAIVDALGLQNSDTLPASWRRALA